MQKRRKGYYSISVVAKMFSVHQQTIRLYEKEGLITPKRSAGNTRLFAEEDVDRLEEIIYLTHKLGVNLAGVEVIIGLQKKIQKLQGEMNALFEQTNEQLKQEGDVFKEAVKGNAKRLLEIKKEAKKNNKQPIDIDAKTGKLKIKPEDDEKEPVEGEVVDDWEIDYNE